MISAKRIDEIFKDCLFKDDEIIEETGQPKDPSLLILCKGIMNNFGFHETRLKQHTEEIKQFLMELPDSFKTSGGGGMSFLSACEDKDGHIW